jgi:DNA polymerase III subunit beta
MNLVVSKENLTQLLYLTNTIVERRNTMPILANVRLSAEGKQLSISATDLEISLVGNVEADVKKSGSTTVSAKVFYDIVKELPGEKVSLNVAAGERLEIQSEQSRFKINCVSADEFPKIAGINLDKPATVDAQRIHQMIEKTAFAVSMDETRYNLNGVYLEAVDKNTIRFVATDGHRLAMIDRPADGIVVNKGVIIPRKGISELKKVLENNIGSAKIEVKEGFFTVQSNNVTLGIRLVDGEFPDYKQVIPVEKTCKIEADRNELASALKRVSLVTTDKTRTIKIKLLDKNLLISSSSPEYGEASESISVSQDGENVTIGFSSRYVIDVLNAIPTSDVVEITFNGELGPAIFTGKEEESYKCIIMPMRFE